MDHADRGEKGKGSSGPQFGSRHSTKITPLGPSVGLPEIDSDDEENGEYMTSSSDDDESPASSSNIGDHKHVRFTPSVLADNSTDSSEHGSFSYNIGLPPAFDSNANGTYRAMLSGLGSGKSPAARGMKPVNARMGLESREEPKKIWYPTEDVKVRRG
jgi:hypothetical protein